MMSSVVNNPITYYHMVNSNNKVKFYTVHQRLAHPQDLQLLIEPPSHTDLLRRLSPDAAKQLVWISAKMPRRPRHMAMPIEEYQRTQPAMQHHPRQRPRSPADLTILPTRAKQAVKELYAGPTDNLNTVNVVNVNVTVTAAAELGRWAAFCDLITRLANLDIGACLEPVLQCLLRLLLKIGALQQLLRAYYLVLMQYLSVGRRNSLLKLRRNIAQYLSFRRRHNVAAAAAAAVVDAAEPQRGFVSAIKNCSSRLPSLADALGHDNRIVMHSYFESR